MMVQYLDGSVCIKNLLQVSPMDVLISNEDLCLTFGYSHHSHNIGVRQPPAEADSMWEFSFMS